MHHSGPSPLIDAPTLIRAIQDPGWRVFDCRFSLADPSRGQQDYLDAHIPGALYAHLDAHLSSPIGPETGRHPLPDPSLLASWLGDCGVSSDTRIVAYDDVGGAFAGRLWWLLRWLGHPHAYVLDGGLPAWLAAGGATSRAVPKYAPHRLTPGVRDPLWVSTARLSKELAAGRMRVIDARAAERFRGEVEPIDPVAGHIPGAINLPLAGNLDADGRFLSPARLRERFTNAIADLPPEQIAHSCGSGVNACHNLLAMEIAGLTGSRLYAGSWSEWIRSPDRPVAVGPG